MDPNGVKPHTAKVTMKMLEEKYTDMIVDWPPSSPGLNLIENLWAILTENTRSTAREFGHSNSVSGSAASAGGR